ncbi:MAG: CsgG/HfaB family protein [Aetokthonos hydrillicola CCALA 1050]|jgi:curli biogenesis system outer membrane secretion channel CsgG|nr:penicillin-binding protein activator LpoB [Aetokthonos hydrillicola CCALA 1050]MBW4586891.1 CsgG/HfaB family protein [Aetokthonos hydrillicola CCALA 1050]
MYSFSKVARNYPEHNTVALSIITSTLLISFNIGNIPQATAKEKVLLPNSTNNNITRVKSDTKDKPRIAVLDFEYSSVADNVKWMLDSNTIGVSEILVNKLVKSGNFQVIERSQLEQVLKEQNLGASGRVDANSAAKIGRVLGVDAVVIGSITGFNIEENNGGLGIPLFGGGKIGGGRKTAHVKLNVRLVNTNTAEILLTAEGNGKSSNGDGSIEIRGYNVDKNSSKEAKLMTNAVVDAVNQVSEQISTNSTKLAAASKSVPSISALVADISTNTVILNKGQSDGYRQGMKLSIERISRQVKDPATGKVIRQVTQPLGTIEIKEVDAQSSVGKILSGTGFKVGDIAKPVEQ